jgi:hypothetical protein
LKIIVKSSQHILDYVKQLIEFKKEWRLKNKQENKNYRIKNLLICQHTKMNKKDSNNLGKEKYNI